MQDYMSLRVAVMFWATLFNRRADRQLSTGCTRRAELKTNPRITGTASLMLTDCMKSFDAQDSPLGAGSGLLSFCPPPSCRAAAATIALAPWW